MLKEFNVKQEELMLCGDSEEKEIDIVSPREIIRPESF